MVVFFNAENQLRLFLCLLKRPVHGSEKPGAAQWGREPPFHRPHHSLGASAKLDCFCLSQMFSASLSLCPFHFHPPAFLECPSDQHATILFIFRDSVRATSPHESFPNSSQANAIHQPWSVIALFSQSVHIIHHLQFLVCFFQWIFLLLFKDCTYLQLSL